MSARGRANRLKLLRAVFDQLPTIECKGLCADNCTAIRMSQSEANLIRERTGKPLATMGPSLRCPYLTDEDRCSIYSDRPVLCRMFGVVEGMPCSHGCKPSPGYLKDEVAMQIIRGLRRAGVSLSTLDHASPEVREAFARLMNSEAERREVLSQAMSRTSARAPSPPPAPQLWVPGQD